MKNEQKILEPVAGLSKREVFAITILQGMIMNADYWNDGRLLSERAINMADVLIAELDKE